MRKLEIIGNLGADAELRNENGSQFVKLSIAENVRRKDASGREYESTEWTNATINGDGGNLLPYLKKGTKVYATGDISLRLFHSEKERRMIPSINLFVRSIELVGGQVDEVPRDLYDLDGVAHRVTKHYYCADTRGQLLYSKSGAEYNVDIQGWVTPKQQPQPDNNNAAGSEAAATEGQAAAQNPDNANAAGSEATAAEGQAAAQNPDNANTAGSEATAAEGQAAAAQSENSESAAKKSSDNKTKSKK